MSGEREEKSIERGEYTSPPLTQLQNPLESASFLSKILLTWLNPIIRLGSQRPLENSDVPPVPHVHSSQYTLDLFLKHWEEEILRNPLTPSFSRVAVRAFGWNFYLSLMNFSLFLVATFLQPTFVEKILQYVNSGSATLVNLHSGIGFAVILGVLSVFQTVVFNLGFYNMQCFGLQIRPALIAALFHKSLRISNSARATHPTGEIMTLMSVDVERVWLATLLGNWLWMSPVMLIVAIVLLFLQVGYPSLIVGFVLILWGYFQELVSGWVNTTRTKLVKCTGQRTMLTNEALQGIRVLKLYAWEDPSQERINDVRREEMTLVRRYSLLRMMNTVTPSESRLISRRFFNFSVQLLWLIFSFSPTL
jgi:ABC-type multidrug transport system fused ATPase/permease subunit